MKTTTNRKRPGKEHVSGKCRQRLYSFSKLRLVLRVSLFIYALFCIVLYFAVDGALGDLSADKMLPPRLFATGRFPSRRLNNYSSLEYLVIVRDALRGSPDYDRLIGSCFGKLFQLPARRCSYSSVMIHAMLVRQVVTKKRFELWPVFGGNPWRFSLVEFGAVTGLPCGEFAEGYVPDYEPTYKEEDYGYWDKLFDCRRDITIPEVVRMVTEDLTLSRSRRFRL